MSFSSYVECFIFIFNKHTFLKHFLKPSASTVLEIDGSPCRDIFTVLNISKNYLKEHLLNVYTFAVLKAWLLFTVSQGGDMQECLTTATTTMRFPGSSATSAKGARSSVESPYSSTFGSSRFYDELSVMGDSEEESSADSHSVTSSSFASSPAFSNFDESMNTDEHQQYQHQQYQHRQ